MTILRILTWSLVSLTATSGLGAQVSQQAPVALTNATVVDVRTGQLRPVQTLLIEKGIITAIGARSQVSVPQGARIVDLRGKYVAPGLIDTHVHLGSQWGGQPADTLAYFGWIVAGGVTTVRDMSTGNVMYKTLVPLRAAIADGRLIGPRIIISAGAREDVLDTLGVRAPLDAMRRYPELGIDGVKIKVDGLSIPGDTPAESLIVMIREARAAGMRAYGHTMIGGGGTVGPDNFTMEAVRAGIQTVSHLQVAVLPERRAWSGPVPAVHPNDPASLRARQLFIANEWKYISDSLTTALIDTMVARQVSLEPTLTYMHAPTFPAEYDWAELTRYQTWRRAPAASRDAEVQAAWEGQWAAYERFLRRFVERGGVVITGTDDSPIAPLGPANEMRLLVRAGVSPLQALQAATLNAAGALGWGDRLGAVEVGKAADLIVLTANPIDDVANVRAIDAVIASGRLLDSATLQQLRARLGTPR